jgi:hypothetical protein
MAKKTVVRLDGAPRRVNRSSGKPTTNCRSTDERFASDAEGLALCHIASLFVTLRV